MTTQTFHGSRLLILTLGFTSVLAFGQPVLSIRRITINGRRLTVDQEVRLERIELYYDVRIPDNDYWYDNRSGAAGFWHGPAVAALPAGLRLGGPMPADCSGGNTGVFVNGRQLHRQDVANLSYLGPCIAAATGWTPTATMASRAVRCSAICSSSRGACERPIASTSPANCPACSATPRDIARRRPATILANK